MAEIETVKKRDRDESDSPESEIDSPEVKRLKEDLLDGLDGDDHEICASIDDLDSFMKSFEVEIVASPSAAAAVAAVTAGGGDGGDGADLGYLLEASDDELGIPPPATTSFCGEAENEFWEISGCDFGGAGGLSGEHVALDGWFDDSDDGVGSGGFTWRPETLPAQ